MITPRLYRRSLRNALQWRLLFLWWASLLLPGFVAAHPVGHYLSSQLDHSTRAKDVVAWMDASTAVDLLRHLGDAGAGEALVMGLLGAVVALLFLAPFMAGAMVAAARSDEPLPLHRLLAGAGEMYGRMFRTTLCGLIPVGIGAALASAALKAAQSLASKAIWETQAQRSFRILFVVAAIVFFLFHLLVDTARAQFVAEPARRSALLALWSAVRLFWRQPLRVLAVGALGSAVGLGLAALAMVLRLRIDQAGIFSILIAWMLAQAAHLSIGWGRAARIFGIAELARADTADRARSEAFRMEPPASSPPPVVQSETLETLVPPSAVPLSPSK